MKAETIMRAVPLTAIFFAAVLTGCSEEPRVDMTGTAAKLAKTIAAEGDHVDVPQLSDWIIKETRDFELVDIRDQDDFQEGHIEGARNIPLAALFSEDALQGLPPGRKVVVYSNGTAHAAQAALLLRLAEREAYALLGGYNYWRAYLNDPAAAGVAEMDPVSKAKYQAVACYFEGDYLADAGLVPRSPVGSTGSSQGEGGSGGAADALGLGLGLGSEKVKSMDLDKDDGKSETAEALGLGLGLGGEAAKALQEEAGKSEGGSTRGLIIRAEC